MPTSTKDRTPVDEVVTRERSGRRPGDYATHLGEEQPPTRERSGKRPGDYAAYFDEKPKTRERSGNRPGDYATHLAKGVKDNYSTLREVAAKKFEKDTTKEKGKLIPSVDTPKPRR